MTRYEKIKELAKEKGVTITGLSQVDFGKKYHIPRRTVENWESGSRKPSETILYLLGRTVKSDYETEWDKYYEEREA